MILYRLRCSDGHEFESWFKDSKTYERQEKKSLIGCPICGDSKVERALMAPRLGKGGKDKPIEAQAALPAPAPAPQQQQVAALGARNADGVARGPFKVREHIEKNCEHVGDKFAEEARKIHYGETSNATYTARPATGSGTRMAEEGSTSGACRRIRTTELACAPFSATSM